MAGKTARDLRLNLPKLGLIRGRAFEIGTRAEGRLGPGFGIFGGWTLPQSDPTDEALATIASILDYPQSHHTHDAPAAGSPPIVPAPAEGYSKIGPGPMAAIRFKWIVRRDEHDAYFVDEMIGESSAPIEIGGPMTAEAAMKLVDDREIDARRRFEQIRNEMIGRSTAADVQNEG